GGLRRRRFLRETWNHPYREVAHDDGQRVHGVPGGRARVPQALAVAPRGTREARSARPEGLELSDLFARDDESLDLRGPFPDLEDLRVAHPLLDGLVFHVA